MQASRPPWSTATKLTLVLLLLGLGIFLLYRFQAIIIPLILAIILAYILLPLANWIEGRLKVRRGFAILLAYLVLIICLTAIPMLLIPSLAAQATELNLDIQRIWSEIESLLGSRYVIAGQTIDPQAALRQAAGSVRGLLEPFFAQTLEFAIEFVTSLVWVIFILVISFYLVKDTGPLLLWIESLVPPAYREDFVQLRTEINLIWAAFFRGQLLLAFIVATIFTLVGFLIGLPFALTMGVLAGLLEFMPSLGQGIWLIIASLLSLFIGSTWIPLPNWVFTLIVIGLHLFFQQFDLNYLIPRVIGRRLHLPPLVVILGIVAGALLAGVLGVVLAAPTIASSRVLGRYLYANLLDLPPFPGPVAEDLPPPNPRWWKKTSSPQNEAFDKT
jgi:predicted PurR-regulated permease PerM